MGSMLTQKKKKKGIYFHKVKHPKFSPWSFIPKEAACAWNKCIWLHWHYAVTHWFKDLKREKMTLENVDHLNIRGTSSSSHFSVSICSFLPNDMLSERHCLSDNAEFHLWEKRSSHAFLRVNLTLITSHMRWRNEGRRSRLAVRLSFRVLGHVLSASLSWSIECEVKSKTEKRVKLNINK